MILKVTEKPILARVMAYVRAVQALRLLIVPHVTAIQVLPR